MKKIITITMTSCKCKKQNMSFRNEFVRYSGNPPSATGNTK